MSVIKNYIYNTVYQVVMMFIPLITMPYLTRVFSPDDLGLTAYTLSIANYFMLFGMLGMHMYGNRQIAFVRDDKEKLNKTFWSLYLTQLITCTLALITYYLFVFFYTGENIVIYLIQGLNIVMVLIDISWLFIGVEDFKNIAIRNSIAKIIGVAAIFIFVKGPEDLALYVLLTALINLFSMIIMWIYAPKYVGKINIDIDIMKKTIKPLLKLFLPQIATQVYMLLARTMIGVLSTNEQVAFYDYSQKIIKVVLALITSIGVVLLPRVSNMMGSGRESDVPAVIEKTFKITSYLAMPMTFGLMAVSRIMVMWFLGPEYDYVGYLTAISSVIIVAISWANIIGIQYLIAVREENKYTISIIIAAIVNLLMNLVLIKQYGAFGAVLSLIAAEFIGVIIQLILVRKKLPVRSMLFGVVKYLVVSIVMALAVVFIGGIISNPMLANVIQGLFGVIVYFGIMYIIKDETQKELINKVKTLILKK